MKTNGKIVFASAILSLTMLVSCSTTSEELGRFTIVSAKNLDFSRISSMKRFSEKTATTELNKKGVFISSKVSDSYVLENALDSALENIPGAVALVDAKLRYITKKRFFSKKYGYVFEGTALVDQNLVDPNLAAGEEVKDCYYFVFDSDADIALQSVDEEKFNEVLLTMN
ncbi:MAG: hypothetical protein NC041_10515 [Bacteroides sp.]|nr:hypothetical protein [Prevotella sp.]MCM1407833.1 hypothetical protein [Treponema brennaborense]MCM1470886.1 hypothetical protein [Bacteroides sp.]